jgi:acetate kinase
MNILALNAGSNSLKFEIVAVEPHSLLDNSNYFGSTLVAGVYDDIGKDQSSFALLDNKQDRDRQKVEVRDHGHATDLLLRWIAEGDARERGIGDFGDIQRVGHRVVHGADAFHGPAQINDEIVRQIEALEDLAPLHNRSALAVMGAAKEKMGATPMFAVFDTVFHQSLPDEAALYPLPLDMSEKHKIRHYGFHGISHRYMLLRYLQISGRPAEKVNVITLHLEGGSSLTAIRRGKSVDTSMGFTPLEGLMMGTRCGDIDPALVTYLMRKEGLDAKSIEQFLNKKCGLLGVSGESADTRVLAKHVSDPRVKLAVATCIPIA